MASLAMCAGRVVIVVVTGGSDDDSRLDEMANDPLLVNTPVPAEVLEQATVAPAREEAFGVREEFHTAVARWSVPLPLNETAAAWANSLVDNDVWHDVVAVCRVYADGERQTGLGARRSAGGYTVSATIDLVPTDAETTGASVVLVVLVEDDGEPTRDRRLTSRASSNAGGVCATSYRLLKCDTHRMAHSLGALRHTD